MALYYLPRPAAERSRNYLCFLSHLPEHLLRLHGLFLQLQSKREIRIRTLSIHRSEEPPQQMLLDGFYSSGAWTCWHVDAVANTTLVPVHKIQVKKEMMISLTFEPHDAVVTALKDQLIYNEWGWDRLRGCGVDFGAVILKEKKINLDS